MYWLGAVVLAYPTVADSADQCTAAGILKQCESSRILHH